MKLIKRIAVQISYDLQGTCNGYPSEQNLADALLNMGKISSATHSNLNQEKLDAMFNRRESWFLSEVDQDLFLCDHCGWWCPNEEMSDEFLVCHDCDEG